MTGHGSGGGRAREGFRNGEHRVLGVNDDWEEYWILTLGLESIVSIAGAECGFVMS